MWRTELVFFFFFWGGEGIGRVRETKYGVEEGLEIGGQDLEIVWEEAAGPQEYYCKLPTISEPMILIAVNSKDHKTAIASLTQIVH